VSSFDTVVQQLAQDTGYNNLTDSVTYIYLLIIISCLFDNYVLASAEHLLCNITVQQSVKNLCAAFQTVS